MGRREATRSDSLPEFLCGPKVTTAYEYLLERHGSIKNIFLTLEAALRMGGSCPECKQLLKRTKVHQGGSDLQIPPASLPGAAGVLPHMGYILGFCRGIRYVFLRFSLPCGGLIQGVNVLNEKELITNP